MVQRRKTTAKTLHDKGEINGKKNMGQTKDITLMWVLQLDKDLEEWRALAEEWLKTIIRGKAHALLGLAKFFQNYLVPHDITRSSKDFLQIEYQTLDFYEICFAHLGGQKDASLQARKIINFIDWILLEKFSDKDDLGNRTIPRGFHNPLVGYLPDAYAKYSFNESDKNVLPYRYIKELRSILCPINAACFKEWQFAQEATDPKTRGGDWLQPA